MNGKRNGKGKEYDLNGRLIFEGEYLNGKKWNGKAKEYDLDNNIRSEFEYLNGNKIKGIEFINKRLEYEGEYKFNKKWNGKGYDDNGDIIYELNNGSGKIIEYNEFGRIIFEGEYLNGKRNGKGKEFNDNFGLLYLSYEGEYLNDKRNGKGKEYDENNNVVFEGEYSNGKRNIKSS